MISCWKAMTLACQSKQSNIAAIRTNETASVSASCDSDAGTFRRRRSLTRFAPSLTRAISVPWRNSRYSGAKTTIGAT